MPSFLILKLQGPMQAWGGHTYEDYRPTEPFPTRSGLVGLIGACLGVDRDDHATQRALSESFRLAVRADARQDAQGEPLRVRRLTDYHTIEKARRVSGKASKNPVQSYREYLCDGCFTAALEPLAGAAFPLARLEEALRRPRYTPVLGRRSCPLGRPVFERVVEADDLHDALSRVPPGEGVIYSELAGDSVNRLRVRDVPAFDRRRQFLTRDVYIHPQEVEDVSL